MISLMCQDALASDRKKMDNFEETVYLIKNCVYVIFYQEHSVIFIVLGII